MASNVDAVLQDLVNDKPDGSGLDVLSGDTAEKIMPAPDPFQALGKGLNMSVNTVKRNYYNAGLMTRLDLTDEQELELIQKSMRHDFGDLSEEQIQASPWWVRAGLDVEGMGAQMANIYSAGLVTGTTAALGSAPLAAGLSKIPVVGGPLAGIASGLTFTGGFTSGSLTALGTQAGGQMYGLLRSQGMSRNAARVAAAAFGTLSAGWNYGAIKATQGLSSIMSQTGARLGLRDALAPMAQKAGFDTASAAARKVQSQLSLRLGKAYLGHVTANTIGGESEIFLDHGIRAAAGMFEKGDWSTYTDSETFQEDVASNFLKLLAFHAVTGAGISVGAYTKGAAVKMTTEQLLTPENVKLIETKIGKMSPSEVLQNIEAAAKEKPYPFEESQGQNVTITEDGRVLRTKDAPEGSSVINAEGRTVLQSGVSVVEDASLLDATTGPSAEQIAAAENVLAQTPLGQVAARAAAEAANAVSQTGVPDAQSPEVQTAIDTLLGTPEDKFAAPDTQGQPIAAIEDSATPLTLEETRARINQVSADVRLLNVEQRRLEAQFNKKEKLGHSTNATLAKLEAVLNAQEELQLEKDLLENGLLTREEIAGAQGRQRMKVLGGIMDRLQKSNAKVAALKQRYDAKVLDARQTGMNVERRSIQTMQKQLRQYINAATKRQTGRGYTIDRDARNELYKLVVGVTTREQFNAAGDAIRDRVIELEQAKIAAAEKSAKQNLIDEIEAMVERGATVKMRSGHPTSGLDADTLNKMKTLVGYLRDQNLPKTSLKGNATRQDLAEKAMVEFNDKLLDPNDPTTRYGDLMASGQAHLIPVEDRQEHQLAVLAHSLDKRTPMELEIIKGTIAQMIADAKNEIAQKQAVLKEQRQFENETVERLVKADTHRRVEGNLAPGKILKQRGKESLANVMSWDALMDYLDPTGELKRFLDLTPAKRTYLVNKELVKAGLKQMLQQELLDAGFDTPLIRYMNDASIEEYEFRYPKTDGSVATARYTRAQLVRIHSWMQDPDLHPTMRDMEKGNGWTLTGDTPPGESFQELVYSVMKPEDFVVSDGIRKFFNFYGEERINPFYREKYGADLPIKENYTPADREVHRVEVGQKRNQMFASLLPGSSKTRVASLRRLKPDNVFEMLDDHIDDWERFRSFDGVFGTLQNVFKRNEKVRTAIKDQYGQGTLDVLDDFIDRFVDDTPIHRSKFGGWFWDAARGSMAKAVLPWRAPIQILQQLTAGTAMWKEHPLTEIVAGYGKMFSGIKNIAATEKAFRESPILKHRYEGGASFDLYTALNQTGLIESTINWATGLDGTITPEQHNALLRLGFEGIRLGDAATVRIFGAGVYWAELGRGKTPEQAMMTVERLVESTQQSDAVDQMPAIYANNPALYALVGQFHLQPLQLFSHEVNALKAFAEAPSPKNMLRLGKQTAILWTLPGLFYGVVQNAPSLIAPPTDNPDLQKQAAVAIGSEAILGPVNGVPIFGDVLEAAWFASMKPLLGVDMKYRAHIGGNSIAERGTAVLDMFAAWEKVFHPKDQTKLSPMTPSQQDPDDKIFKALFKTARSLGPLTGTPTQFINAPAGIVNALRHGDFVGAMFAAGGWSPGSLQQRYQAEDSMALPKFGEAEPESLVDWLEEGLIQQEPQPAKSDETLQNLIEDTLIYGTVDNGEATTPAP